MQTEGTKITLLPAWPQGWEGDFKLNAPFQTTVQGTISNGTVINLIVTPAERAADVTILSSIKASKTGWIASASNNNANASRAIDGNSNTRWDSQSVQTPGQTFTVNFGEMLTFNKLILEYQIASGDGPEGFELLVSDNGTDWTESILNGKGSNGSTEMSFQTVTTQYIRIKQTGSKNLYWSIAELNVYNVTSDKGTVGILPIKADAFEIEIIPNPAKDFIVVKAPFKNYIINITDLDGRLVMSVLENDSQLKINTKYLKKGMYLVNVIYGNKQVSKKLIIP